MSSIIKVDTFQDTGGNALFSSDGSGTVTLNNSAMKMTPSFHAYLAAGTGDQAISTATLTTISFDTERYDSDGKYDTSTYRFTPGVAGMYYVYAMTRMTDGNSYLAEMEIRTSTENSIARNATPNTNSDSIFIGTTAELGASDYVYVTIYQGSGSTRYLNSGDTETYFGGFRIIGA